MYLSLYIVDVLDLYAIHINTFVCEREYSLHDFSTPYVFSPPVLPHFSFFPSFSTTLSSVNSILEASNLGDFEDSLRFKALTPTVVGQLFCFCSHP